MGKQLTRQHLLYYIVGAAIPVTLLGAFFDRLLRSGQQSQDTEAAMSTSESSGGQQSRAEEVAQWLDSNILNIMAVVVVVIVLAVLISGTLGVLKSEPVVTKWMVYLIAGAAIMYGFYFVVTELLHGAEADEVRKQYQENWAARLDPRSEGEEKSWTPSGGQVMLGLLILISLVLLVSSFSKGENK